MKNPSNEGITRQVSYSDFKEYVAKGYVDKVVAYDNNKVEFTIASDSIARIFGESPIEYIISRRIDAAIYMLRNSDKSLAEIAEFAGYNDVYYFSRHFKRKTGISPGQYRKYGLK